MEKYEKPGLEIDRSTGEILNSLKTISKIPEGELLNFVKESPNFRELFISVYEQMIREGEKIRQDEDGKIIKKEDLSI